MLLSVPVELSTDHFELLAIAQEEGYVSQELLAARSTWPAARFDQVINLLLREGIVWVDDYKGDSLHVCIITANCSYLFKCFLYSFFCIYAQAFAASNFQAWLTE